jgi:hypothetical protein
MRRQQTLKPTRPAISFMKDQNEQEMEEELKKGRYRPPMTTADNPEHDEHIRKLRGQKKKA